MPTASALVLAKTRALTQLLQTFAYQSYFSNSLLQNAILAQPVNSPIVTSTIQTAQTPGIGVAVHPSSDSPVAFRFRGGFADSSVVVLTPGQKAITGPFRQFDWGLPFGWLGGGQAVVYIIHNPDADLQFTTRRESIPFHRTRLIIDTSTATLRINWPGAFPWSNAASGANASPQAGGPGFNIEPTYIMCRLRVNGSTPQTISFVWRSIDDFDTDSSTGSNVVSSTDQTTYDLTFSGTGLATAFPIAWLPAEVAGLVGDSCAVNAISSTQNGQYIDVVRYGRLS